MTTGHGPMYLADTIVACATPAGRGALAIVRCSGPEVARIRQAIFEPHAKGEWEPWKMRLGNALASGNRAPVDEALAVFFPQPHSFTGEDTLEIHCHGSPVIVEQVVASAISAGARAAERGEFTRRAVLNGKLDLLQAEAIADLIDAKMAAGARAAWQQLQGALSDEFAELRSHLVAVLAEIEADVDFTDDELPEANFHGRCVAIAAVETRLAGMLDGFAASRRQREGVRVVFTGKPNAGKSSLVNRLLSSGRMIVSEEPGTTRDVVEEAVDLEGVAFVLTDTAGIRETEGRAESLAVERALESAREADLCVLAVDAAAADALADLSASETREADTILVWNKIDLARAVAADHRGASDSRFAAVLRTSALTGDGCDSLREMLVTIARERMQTDHAGISRVRHRAALERAIAPLRRAAELAGREEAAELAAVELRTALAELAAIAAPVDNEEVLDRIFSEFCIGK